MIKLRTFLLTVIVLLGSATLEVQAHDFEVNGFYYNYCDKTAKTVEVTFEGKYYYQNGITYEGIVKIPEQVFYEGVTYTVTRIGDYTFRNDSVISVQIPNTIEGIGQYAFQNCSKLRSIFVPSSVTYIGSTAFGGCTNLSIVLNNSNLDIIAGKDNEGLIGNMLNMYFQ